jgi:hypothetical protein
MKQSGIARSAIALTLFLGAARALADGNFFLHTGSPVSSQTTTAQVNGQQVSITEMVSALHEMNIPNGRQPIGLWVHFPVAANPGGDSASGHLAFCRAAFEKVATDQQNQKSTDQFRAYFQITIDPSFQLITTDNGDPVYQENAVNCWEAMDPRSEPK